MKIHFCRSGRNSGVLQATVIWECLELEGQTIRPWVVAKGHMGALRCPYNVFLVQAQPVSLTVMCTITVCNKYVFSGIVFTVSAEVDSSVRALFFFCHQLSTYIVMYIFM